MRDLTGDYPPLSHPFGMGPVGSQSHSLGGERIDKQGMFTQPKRTAHRLLPIPGGRDEPLATRCVEPIHLPCHTNISSHVQGGDMVHINKVDSTSPRALFCIKGYLEDEAITR